MRVAPAGDEGGEIKSAADVGASAPDMACAAPVSAIAGVRGKAGETGDGAPVEATEFGQPGEEDAADDRAYARRERRRAAATASSSLAFICVAISFSMRRRLMR